VITLLIGLAEESAGMVKRGTRTMTAFGLPCAALLGGILLLQQIPATPVWALLILYAAFLVPHTMLLVAVMREMLFEQAKERLLVALRWKPRHTNFLYDSLFFLGVAALILFSVEAIILVSEEYAEVRAALEEQAGQDEVAYIAGLRETFVQIQETGLLALLSATALMFLLLMVVWARNVIQMPATAAGFRIQKDESRMMMQGSVLLVAAMTMIYNGLIAGIAVALRGIPQDWVPVSYKTAGIVAVTYWLAVWVNAAFWCSIFRIFTEGYRLRTDFKGA